MADKKGAAVQPQPPRRYGEIFNGSDDPALPGNATSPVRTLSSTPASVLGGGINPPAPAFDRVTSEDKPGDRDRKTRKPIMTQDPISFQLELDEHSDKPSFPWCSDYAGYPIPFSRRYWADDVIVDLYAGDHPHVREEVTEKRAAIIDHNAKAEVIVERMREAAKKQAEKLVAQDKKEGITAWGYERHLAVELDNGMMLLRRKGDVPFGYAPIIGNIREIDPDELKRGKVFDLPPAAEEEPESGNARGTIRRRAR
jgi:hypothetical protein